MELLNQSMTFAEGLRAAGAVLFGVLTGVTLWARPAPLALGRDALRALEERLAAAGRGGLLVSWQGIGC